MLRFPAVVLLPDKNGKVSKRIGKLLHPYSFENNITDQIEKCECSNPPLATCSSCNGTGHYKTSYNASGQFCYWCIGGDYDGKMTQREPVDLYQIGNYSFEEDAFLANNSCRALDLPEEFANHFANDFINSHLSAVITPDGKYHNLEDAEDPEDPEDRTRRVKRLLSKHGECTAVMCELSF
jgi:hypothetical protein